MTPHISNIITDTGKKYRITFQYVLIFEDDRSVEGLGDLIISLIDEKELPIERIGIGFDINQRGPQVVS